MSDTGRGGLLMPLPLRWKALRDPLLLPVLEQIAARLLAGLFGLAAIVIVAVSLGVETQGRLATSLAVVAALSLLGGSGVSHGVAYVFAARRSDASRGVALIAIGVCTALGLGLGVLAVLVLPAALPFLPVVWWAVAVALPLSQVGQVGLGLHQGTGNARAYSAVLLAAPATLVTVAVAASGSVVPLSADGWVGILVVAPFLIQAAIVLPTVQRLPSGSGVSVMGELLRYSARIYPSTLAHYAIYRLDLLIVASFLGPGGAGVYSLAIAGVDAIARLPQSAATLLYRSLAGTASSRDAFTAAVRAARISSSASLALAVGLAVVLFALGSILSSDAIRAIAILVAILAPGSAAIAAWILLASYLAARGRLGPTARVNFTVLGLSVVLYLWLIPTLGLLGGALATTVSYVASATLGYRESVRSARHTPTVSASK